MCACVRVQEVVVAVEETLMLHYLCDYVYKVVQKFGDFFRDCHVLGTPEQEERLMLCLATLNAVKAAFSLIGITPVNRL